MSASRCSSSGCGNTTRDPSGRCHHHIRTTQASTTRTSLAATLPPTSAVTPIPEYPADEWEPGTVHPIGGYDEVQHHDSEWGDAVVIYQRNHQPHREDGPAVINKDGSVDYYIHGKLHRTDGPARQAREDDPTAGAWYQNGVKHRVGGPAVGTVGGDVEEYWVEGKLHRTDGPALRNPSLTKWCVDGKDHRYDGPAVTYALSDGIVRETWSIHGEEPDRLLLQLLRRSDPATARRLGEGLDAGLSDAQLDAYMDNPDVPLDWVERWDA